jgi:hypothetical protein
MWQLSLTTIFDPRTGLCYRVEFDIHYPKVICVSPGNTPPIVFTDDEAVELWTLLWASCDNRLGFTSLTTMHNDFLESGLG